MGCDVGDNADVIWHHMTLTGIIIISTITTNTMIITVMLMMRMIAMMILAVDGIINTTITLICHCENRLADIHNTIYFLLYNFTYNRVVFIYGTNIK